MESIEREIHPALLTAQLQQRPGEFTAWLDLCRAAGVRSYVEIGFASGDSAKIAAEVLQVPLAAIDRQPWAHRRDPEMIERLPWGGVFGVTVHWGNSRDPQIRRQVLATLGLSRVDAVYVDGDHSLEGVSADYRVWWPVTAKLMGFHDSANRDCPDVAKFMEELADTHLVLHLRSTGDPGAFQTAMGIAVVWR